MDFILEVPSCLVAEVGIFLINHLSSLYHLPSFGQKIYFKVVIGCAYFLV